MTASAAAGAPNGPLPAPFKRCRRSVPRLSHRVKPRDDFLRRPWVTPVEGAPLQNPLHGLGHIQPGAAQWRVHQHNPLVHAPTDKLGGRMPREIIED